MQRGAKSLAAITGVAKSLLGLRQTRVGGFEVAEAFGQRFSYWREPYHYLGACPTLFSIHIQNVPTSRRWPPEVRIPEAARLLTTKAPAVSAGWQAKRLQAAIDRRSRALARARARKAQSGPPATALPGSNPPVTDTIPVVAGQPLPIPTTSEAEAAMAPVVARAAIGATRDIEWANVLLGFEQANKYSLRDNTGALVGFIAEEASSLSGVIFRQLLGRRRYFKASVFDVSGREVFRLKRPFYFISSNMVVETPDGQVIGEVKQRWHLWRRNYDLYYQKKQFAAVEAGFLSWNFELKDERGGPMAAINRDWSGFGKELFTDAGMYAIHLGDAVPSREDVEARARGAGEKLLEPPAPDSRPQSSELCKPRVRTLLPCWWFAHGRC
eukprot:jgi/Mesvir1/11738/Mv00112-RA.2